MKSFIDFVRKMTLVEGLIIVAIVAIFAFLIWMKWPKTDTESAVNTLTRQGYIDVEVVGASFFGCAEEDIWRTKFIATSPSGHTVEGIVCKGILKGATIRFDD